MRRLAIAAAAAAGAAWFWWHPIEHWIAYATGSYNTPGTPHNYNFNSGFGSVILPPVITVAGAGVLMWWHHQCHVSGCWWYARRQTAAGDRACWRHNPGRRLTADELRRRHHLYLGSKPGRG